MYLKNNIRRLPVYLLNVWQASFGVKSQMTNPKNFTLVNSFAPLRGFHRAGKTQTPNSNDQKKHLKFDDCFLDFI